MADQGFPLDSSPTLVRRPSTRTGVSFERLMEQPMQRKTPLGTDTAWALKLKTCVDTVVKELHIDVVSAKPIRSFEEQDPRDMLFEVDTTRGPLEVIRKRTGEHTFAWKANVPHNR